MKNRRVSLQKKIGKQAVLLLAGNNETERTNDVPYPFRQSSNMLYLTAYDQPDAYLLLTPDQETLFVKQLLPFMAVWEGRSNHLEHISRQTGITHVVEYKKREEIVEHIAQEAIIYLDMPDSQTAQPAAWQLWRLLQEERPDQELAAINPLIDDLRVTKDESELTLIHMAVAETQAAIAHVTTLLQPGISERAIAAEFVSFAAARGYEQAFPPIVSFGKNGCIIHHTPDDTILQSGDLVLLDVGVEVDGYAGDISRTILPDQPSQRLQAVYEAVTRVQQASIQLIKPGVTYDAYEEQTAQIMAQELVKLGLFESVEAANQPEGELQWPAYRRYFNHYVSHFMGLDAHDVGPRDATFAPGMVLTCEPGIYIAEEGIGIRIEDDLLITAAGTELLTAEPMQQ